MVLCGECTQEQQLSAELSDYKLKYETLDGNFKTQKVSIRSRLDITDCCVTPLVDCGGVENAD